MTYEDMLMENDFHEVVNEDFNKREMYDDVNALPAKTDDMVSATIGIVQKHVSEVWSQPRVTAMVPKYDLIPGPP